MLKPDIYVWKNKQYLPKLTIQRLGKKFKIYFWSIKISRYRKQLVWIYESCFQYRVFDVSANGKYYIEKFTDNNIRTLNRTCAIFTSTSSISFHKFNRVKCIDI